ncbi:MULTISPECIES: bifunctional methylenetetrahydrofolate dehydrogenase/methenyltetrahydrofolate cyclohydrolase FolD [unclassified Methanoculleus]|uniref:bifunctional methylenetetrahydrofolate dehydrogenase/methenyltetrahydrofolate cyclohydrolase FolD n=1 Tax=unclassified Methanoculleus TaxID=2619537 RepID=UPI0025D88986|nr:MULTISPECIES: bifunctional methylenetetrahydrofolate dehydrogenase/methenyltetrahydrofolate cyclohydrolase FolD [unclassified Methanoculleus]MDD2786956.1 bifunctional methylenetetrahydrofolate dehydrogenase/methenyltetrahydrofolate cyclohydrolase FolD [Methanoculleus sp.]MDD4314243.1 bifunctional methylenetetrahydrofolate dehydrogenase/methenyltetrahydrofolate cyclohydrolase FolD [Methanoculleus sp.]MDD4470367.1 bifunctional methylenetetrahydrofolate dehydrogenase/methenyltetrahydrofolate cyc
MILDGKAVSEKRLEILKEEIEESRLYPRLATIIVGEDPGSKLYVRMKHRACERVGIGSVGIELPEDASTERVLETVTRLNNDPEIDGILVQLPLPSGVDTTRVINAVAPGKDVDGFHPCNLGRLLAGTPVFAPCTPQGIMTILDEYKIPIAGKRAVVVGRSIDVGRPMAALLLNADATVTICHSKTRNLEDEMRNADILVSAIGKLKFVGTDMIKAGATVIDVGINYDEQGKLHGDVDFEAVRDRAGAITPVPGGVGPMTIATLMENTFLAAKLRTCGTVR